MSGWLLHLFDIAYEKRRGGLKANVSKVLSRCDSIRATDMFVSKVLSRCDSIRAADMFVSKVLSRCDSIR